MVAQAAAPSTSSGDGIASVVADGDTHPPPGPQTLPASNNGEHHVESGLGPGSPKQGHAAVHARMLVKPTPILTAPPMAFAASAAREAPLSSSSVPSSAISSRSLRSPSPSRRQAFAARELDPLLANLSPMATLEALKASDAVDKQASSQHRELAESIAHVSPAERALGIRAAVAGKKLREWFAEVEAWEMGWKGFAMPGTNDDTESEEADTRSEEREGAMTRVGNRTAKELAEGRMVHERAYDTEYWGSLPAATVVDHERRLDDIQDEMEALELEELKSYVRKAHLLSRSRKNTSNSSGDTQAASKQSPNHRQSSSYTKLDDFTVVITATIMQSLPHLSRLSSLIELWQTRLLVLRRVPRFLHLLYGAQTTMLEAVAAIDDESRSPPFSRNEFYTTRDILRAKNNVLGEMLDSMLDALDGREDTVPDDWIEGMEGLERGYSEWVADAEDAVMNNILGVRRVGQMDDEEREKKRLTAIQEAEAEAAEEESSRATESRQETIASMSASEDAFETPDEGGPVSPENPDKRLSIPRIDEPGNASRPVTIIRDGEPKEPDSAGGFSLSSEMSETEAELHRESLHSRHFSATYSTITASPEITTADTVEYFNVTPHVDEEAAKTGAWPALLEVQPRKSSGGRSRSTSGERRLSPGGARVGDETLSTSRSRDAERRLSPASQRLSVQSTNSRRASSTKSQMTAVRRHSSRSVQDATAEGFEPTMDMDDLQHSPAPSSEPEDMAGNAINEQLESFHQSEFQRFEEEAGYADVEDAEITDTTYEYETESAFSGYNHRRNQSQPWTPRKSSSDDTRERSFHTRSSSGMQPNGRSRASTLNTYETWSDHEDSEEEGEGDVHGGLRSYRRMQLPAVQERSQSRPRSKVLQAQVDPSFSYDDMFDSLVQPLSQPGSPTREMEEVRPMSSHLMDDELEPVRVDFTKRPSISALSTRREDDDIGRTRIDFTRRPSIPGLSLGRGDDARSRSNTSLESQLARPSIDFTKRPSKPGLAIPRSRGLLRDNVPAALTQSALPRRIAEPHQNNRIAVPSRNTSQTSRGLSSPIPAADDQFATHISTLLSRIPAPIRLSNNPPPSFDHDYEQQSPPGSPVTDPRTALSSNPPGPDTGLTLAPAASPSYPKQQSTHSPRSAPAETKLYHLHQPGRAAPIKLLVRLVGENGDRVMVRVGGGWCELEEWLKEYACHHGRAARLGGEAIASGEWAGTGIEVQSFDSGWNGNGNGSVYGGGNGSRNASLTNVNAATRSAAGSRAASPAPLALPTPATAPVPVHSKDYISRARRHVSASAHLARPPPKTGPASPAQTSPLANQYQSSPPVSAPGSPDTEARHNGPAAWPTSPSTPAQPSPAPSSTHLRRPSTSSLVSHLTHTRSWSVFRPLTPTARMGGPGGPSAEALGPAGPGAGNGARDLDKEMSPRKKAWVEGVMRQARRVSGVGAGRKSVFGGEVAGHGGGGGGGGTKRVFMRKTGFN